MSVLIRATRRNIPEDGILHCRRRENLQKSLLHYRTLKFISSLLIYIYCVLQRISEFETARWMMHLP
jgi:hypothetical protein